MELSFSEEQKFRKWWHFLIAGFPMILISSLYILAHFNVIEAKENDHEQIILFIVMILMALIFFWFLFLRLETRINKQGIQVTFHGIPFCKRTIRWNEISSISVIHYSPLSDFGGWGVKYSLTEKGWCYNVAGTTGIKIIYTNKNNFLIGTQKKEEAEKIINYYIK